MGRKVAIKASKMNSTADLNDDTDPSHNISTNTNANTNTSCNSGTNTNTSTNTNTNSNADANTNTNHSTNTSTSTSTNTNTSTSTDTDTSTGTEAGTNADTNADANADADSGAVEILPYLFLGPRSTAASKPFIRAHGITHVLSIGASPPGPALPGLVYTRVPMLDSPSVRIENVYQRAREAIETVRPPDEVSNRVDSQSSPSSPVLVQAKEKQKIKQNQKQKEKEKKILVHCSTAVSRSPSIVAAYLMSEHNMSLRESLGRIVRARPAVNPNPGLFAQLKEMEVRIRGYSSMEGVGNLPRRKEERVRLFEEYERAHDEDEEDEEEWGLKKIEEEGEIDSFFPVTRANYCGHSSRISSNLLRRLNEITDGRFYIPLDFVIDTVILVKARTRILWTVYH
ncbi:hypothetical protein ACEPAI_1162 [Sanghuangporus weigelae]